MLLQLVKSVKSLETKRSQPQRLDVAAIYAQHAQFLWKSLYRMGVAEADLPDALQEVLWVVHRRLDSFDSSCRLTTWLFGICLRVTATVRRARRRRREELVDPLTQDRVPNGSASPEQSLMQQDARRSLEAALDALDPEKRAVFVMFELEGVGCAEIATLLGVPKGTVFSRLAQARRTFLEAIERAERIEQRKSMAMGGIK
jgi:RNA polymerase sigma-70 factor (ECF subfamily)